MTLLEPHVQVQIDSADSFFIENHHSTAVLSFMWSKLPFRVAPGMKKIVPFEVVCLYFGDPRSVCGRQVPYRDSKGSGMVPDRNAEVMRLAVRYGVYEQGAADIRGALKEENLRLEQVKATSIRQVLLLKDDNFYARITDLDGTEIVPPLFDHTGEQQYGFNIDDQRADDIAVIISQMQSKIDRLERQASNIPAEVAPGEDVGIPIDNPGEPVSGLAPPSGVQVFG